MGGAKRILWTAALFFVFGQSSLWAQNRIEWISSWPEAQALAVKHQRLVLVHFWRPSCMACQKLERSVFNQPEFIRAVYSNYVAMSVNLAETPDAGKHFGVQQTPTDIILAVDGKEFFRTTSPADMGRYIAMLDETAAHARVNMNMPVAASGPESPSALAPASSFAAGGPAPANRSVGGSEFPLPTAAPPANVGRTAQPEYVTNQWAVPAGNTAAPPIPEQRASYTAEYGGEFRPAAGAVPSSAAPSAAPPTQPYSQFPSPSQPTSTLGPPAGASTVEPPVYEAAASTMPYRGAATAGTPPAADPLLPPNAARTDAAPSQGAQGAPRNPMPDAGIALPPTAGAPQNPPLALDGYCPVTLVESEKWVKGDPKFGAHHQGRTYLFASADAQAKFLQGQGYEKYAPALSGYDPVKYAERGELVDGKRVHGVFFHNQVFLFADEAGLQQFWADPERYATIVRAEHERSAMRTNTQR